MTLSRRKLEEQLQTWGGNAAVQQFQDASSYFLKNVLQLQDKHPWHQVQPALQSARAKRNVTGATGVKSGLPWASTDIYAAEAILRENGECYSASENVFANSIQSSRPSDLSNTATEIDTRPISVDVTTQSTCATPALQPIPPIPERLTRSTTEIEPSASYSYTEDKFAARIGHSEILSILKLIEAAVGQAHVKVIDPFRPDKNYSAIQSSATIILPCSLRNHHSILAIILPDRKYCDIFDSIPSTSHSAEAEQVILGFYREHMKSVVLPEFNSSSPLRYNDKLDSGICATIAGVYRMIGEYIPHRVDLECWRRICHSILASDEFPVPSNQDVSECIDASRELLKTPKRHLLSPNSQELMTLLIRQVQINLRHQQNTLEVSNRSPYASESLRLLRRVQRVSQENEGLSAYFNHRLQRAIEMLESEHERSVMWQEMKELKSQLSELHQL